MPIESIGRSRPQGPVHEHDEATARPAPHRPPPPPPARETPRDRAILRFAQAQAQARAPAPPRPEGDGIVYLGMNSDGGQHAMEARSLPGAAIVKHGEEDRALGADHVRIGHGPAATIVDLGTREGSVAFAGSLGVSDACASRVARVLHRASPGSRDELAGLAQVFARGERGEAMPSRLVLSGHSGGVSLFDGAGKVGALSLSDVRALAAAMPNAAARVEDLMLSACNTGHPAAASYGPGLDTWREAFPNLKVAWGYGGDGDRKSPSGAGAVDHIARFRAATRGRTEQVDARAAMHGSWLGANVALWTAKKGYVGGR